MRFADQVLLTQAIDGSAAELEFAFTRASGESFTLTAHGVYLPRPRLPIQGPAGVQASFGWQAARDPVTGRMATAILVNNVQEYSWCFASTSRRSRTGSISAPASA